MAAIPPFSSQSHHTDLFWTVIIAIIIVCELGSEVVFVSNLSVFPSWPLSFCGSLSLINLFNWVESSICSHAHFSSFMAHLGKIIIIGLVQPGGLKSAGVLLSNSERIIQLLETCTLHLHFLFYQLSRKKPWAHHCSIIIYGLSNHSGLKSFFKQHSAANFTSFSVHTRHLSNTLYQE